jgi:hypothetical protein
VKTTKGDALESLHDSNTAAIMFIGCEAKSIPSNYSEKPFVVQWSRRNEYRDIFAEVTSSSRAQTSCMVAKKAGTRRAAQKQGRIFYFRLTSSADSLARKQSVKLMQNWAITLFHCFFSWAFL